MYACLPCLRALRFRREAPLSPQGAPLLCRPPPQESDAPDALVDRDDPGHAGAGQKAQIKHIWQAKEARGRVRVHQCGRSATAPYNNTVTVSQTDSQTVRQT